MAEGSDMIDLLTIEEVAERLRVSVLTVRWLRQEGQFAPAIKVGRRLVWDARDVAAWLESHREPTEVVNCPATHPFTGGQERIWQD